MTTNSSKLLVCILAILLQATCVIGTLHADNPPVVMDTVQYPIPVESQLDDKALKNNTYMVPMFGSMLDGSYNDDGPLEPVTFSDGVGAAQGAEIKAVAINKDASRQLAAAVFIESFDGFNGGIGTLCLITRTEKGYLAYQHEVIASRSINMESVALNGDVAVVSFLYTGKDDATCCPTARGKAYYKIQEGKMIRTKTEGASLEKHLYWDMRH